MTIRSTWTDLSARLHGLIDASKLAADLFRNRGDSVEVIVRLRDHASAILSDLRAFQPQITADFPSAAQAIARVSEQIGSMLADQSGTQDTRQIHVRSAIVILAALDGEISYLLRDSQDAIRSRAERAFEHLQRLIAVDDDVRTKWRAAYAISETKCERLGAVHLLQHAIWAFKANAGKRPNGSCLSRSHNKHSVDRARERRPCTNRMETARFKRADCSCPYAGCARSSGKLRCRCPGGHRADEHPVHSCRFGKEIGDAR